MTMINDIESLNN